MKNKLKSLLYILIFLFSFGNIFANSQDSESVWFAIPSEYKGVEKGIKNGDTYKDSWYAFSYNQNITMPVEVFESLDGIEKAKSGKNFFAISADSANIAENSWMAIKFNKNLEANKSYNTRFWYQNGSKKVMSQRTQRYKIETDVYLVKELPTIKVNSEGNNSTEYLKDKKHVGKLKDTNTTTWKNICSLDFTVEENGEYYLLFIPKIEEENPSKSRNTVLPGYFVVEQANSPVIEMGVTATDVGVKFLEGKYKEIYGKEDNIIGKNEKVKVVLKLQNTSEFDWSHENHIQVDVSNIGTVETGTDSFAKVKLVENEERKEILLKDKDYSTSISNGGTILDFKGNGLNNKNKADYYEYVFYISYDYRKEKNLNIYYKIFDSLNSKIKSGTIEEEKIEEGKITFKTERDVAISDNIKNHSILKVPKTQVNKQKDIGFKGYLVNLNNKYINKFLGNDIEIVKLGDTVGGNTGINGNDGWIETLRSTKKTLYFGNNTLKIKASHSGYLSGFLYKGKITPNGTVNFQWEKMFEVPVTGIGEAGNPNGDEIEKELYEGINRITFTTPSDTDEMTKFILKYSINREDVKSLQEYGMSGEVEEYEIDPGKSFSANIVKRDDFGVPQDSINGEKNIGISDKLYSYREKVKYTIEIKNGQTVQLRNKKLTFKSNMAVVDTSSLLVNETGKQDGIYTNSKKIPRIEKIFLKMESMIF